jgi:hypothetical protein
MQSPTNINLTWIRKRVAVGAVLLLLVTLVAQAARTPDRSYAPMPNYDIRKGYAGWIDREDPRIAAELASLREQRRAKFQFLTKATVRASWPKMDDSAVKRSFGEGSLVTWNANATPRQIFNEKAPLTSSRIGLKPKEVAHQFLRDYSQFFRLSEDQLAGLKLVRTRNSQTGATQVNFQQTVGGIPVFGGDLKVSLDKNNAVVMVGGTLYPDLQVRGSQSLASWEAAKIAAGHVGPWMSNGHLKPLPATAWKTLIFLPNWDPKAVRRESKAPRGPQVLRREDTRDQVTWLSPGPFRQVIRASLVAFPLTALEGRWAWKVALLKTPTEWYQIIVDAEDGTLLNRTNLVQFGEPQGKVFPKNPDATPQQTRSFKGTPPATPASKTFVPSTVSGTRGNNVTLGLGAHELPGTDRHFLYDFKNRYEKSGLVFNNIDTNRKVAFVPNASKGYKLNVGDSTAVEPPPGGNLGLTDETAVCGSPPSGFTYFGQPVSFICVTDNGYITVDFFEVFNFVPDPINLFSPFSFPAQGRILGFWADLDPGAGGFVGVSFPSPGSLCFKWNGVPGFGVGGSNTFSICLFDTGKIRMTYPTGSITAPAGAVGIMPPFPGTAAWSNFSASGTQTRGKTGLARFFPDTGKDTQVAATNLFWQLNENGHDRLWFQGFDEDAGNFQRKNFGRGGLQGDPILAGLANWGFNNAFFGTPPDGVCCPFTEFFLFTDPPFRQVDSSLDSDIVMHEHAHGLTNRLVGGPANPVALNAIQSGGMGEGWSDFYALSLSGDPVMGEYSTGNTSTGIRRVAYTETNGRSLDQFGNISGPISFNQGTVFFPQVHADGEIWASMLASVRNKLLTAGLTNEEVEQLVTEALFFTPANPSMLDGRNAVLAADMSLHGGAQNCELWGAFAARGFGRRARNNDFPLDLLSGSSFSVFASRSRPKKCGGAFSRGPLIKKGNFDKASVGAQVLPSGWEGSGLWHVSARRSSTGTQSFYYGQEGPGNYNTGGANWGVLKTPPLDLTGVENPVLEFDVAISNEGLFPFDILWVRIPGISTSGDRQRAILFWSTPDFFLGDIAFHRVRIDLSPLANTSGKRVQFYFDTLDSIANSFEGIYIDNVQIRSYVMK